LQTLPTTIPLRVAIAMEHWSLFAGSSSTDDRVLSFELRDVVRLVMVDGDLERKRGINITSKVTRLSYQEEGGLVNVVDTPGHADFCGEVDRVLGCVSGVLGLRPVCVLNKLDRPGGLA